MFVILPGHYQTKSSVGSEKPEIIRILGADKTKPDNWLTSDKRSIPSYIIEEEYIALDTQPIKKDSNNSENKKNIFADFATVNINEIPNSPSSTDKAIIAPNNDEIIFSKYENKEINDSTPTPPVHTQKSDVSIILEKINIDNLNRKINVDEIKKPIINISIPIQLNYELSKLKVTIDLMELNIDEVIENIIESTNIENIKTLLISELKKYILLNVEEKQQIIEEKKPEVKKIETTIIEEKIEEKENNAEIIEKVLSETENYILTNIINK